MNGIPRQDTLPAADVVQSRPDWTQPGRYRTDELPWRWLHAEMAVVDSDAGSRGDSDLPGVESSSGNSPDRLLNEATASLLGHVLVFGQQWSITGKEEGGCVNK